MLLVGWLGAVDQRAWAPATNCASIASSVIGGADLMGGEGGAYGAFIGAALHRSDPQRLLLAGVDPNWQGTFVGLFIVLAVLLEQDSAECAGRR